MPLWPPCTFSDFLTTKSFGTLASGAFGFFFVSLFSCFFLIFISSFLLFVLAFLDFSFCEVLSSRSLLYSRKFAVRLRGNAESLRVASGAGLVESDVMQLRNSSRQPSELRVNSWLSMPNDHSYEANKSPGGDLTADCKNAAGC